MRKIVTPQGTFTYTIGQTCARIIDAEGHTRLVPLDELTERTPDTIERGRWKKTSDGMVTPRDVANWIRGHIE